MTAPATPAGFAGYAASDTEADELARYAGDGFDRAATAAAAAATAGAGLPLADEPFVAAWDRYAAEAAATPGGAAGVLRRRLIQLRFPVEAGVSKTAAYQDATRRGVLPNDEGAGAGARLECPDRVRLFVHPTAAGRIPVVVASARADFETLVRVLTRRNEPDPVPLSMGACMVAGYNNWDRVGELRRRWATRHPDDVSGAGWAAEFRRIVPQPELYQDRFVILSDGPYSATPATAVGMSATAWVETSLTIRLEHECAHYFTKRVLGSMRNALLDELIADYAGVVAAAGEFRAAWLLRFLGLEAFPGYRPGGRLENYRGTPPLGDGAFVALQRVVVAAAENLERFDRRCGPALRGERFGTARAIVALARVGLERVAGPGGDRALEAALAE